MTICSPQDGISMEEWLPPLPSALLLPAIGYHQLKSCQVGAQLLSSSAVSHWGTLHLSCYGRKGITKLPELQRTLEIFVLYATEAAPPQ